MTNQRIKIFTGNFTNVSKYKDCFPVSIALYNKFWEGACYRPLNPTWDMMQHESEEYTKMYYAKLRKMDAKTVYDDLCKMSRGKDVVMLCYEKEGDFCHRRLAAAWLENHLGIEVKELGNGKETMPEKPKIVQTSLFD